MKLLRTVGVIACLSLAGAMSLSGQQRPAASATDQLAEGNRLLRRGDNFKALQAFRDANRSAGDQCAECTVGMAEAMLAMKAYQNALDTAALAVDLAHDRPPLLARAHGVRGSVYQGMAEKDSALYADAEREFRLAADLDHDNDDVLYGLGVVLLKQRRDDEGVAVLRKFLEIRDLGPTADEVRGLIANPRRARERFIPAFSIVAADRKTITPESLRGKVALFDFWGTRCGPCVSALPSLRALQQRYADAPFVIVSVSADDDEEVWRRFIAKNSMVWPQFRDATHELDARFGIGAYPTYVLIDREGVERLRVENTGFNKARDLAKAIDQELARTPP